MNQVHESVDWYVFSRVWDVSQSRASADVRVKARFRTWDSVEEIMDSVQLSVTDMIAEKRVV
mgnify:CR=1 FL=1